MPLFVTSVNDTGGKFAAGVVDTGGNLPPASKTLAKIVEKFATGVVETGSKFATGVVGTGGNFAAGVVDTGGKHQGIPVVHLDSRISPRIFEKIRNGLNGILWGWGETDS